jgi:hypothetical protein
LFFVVIYRLSSSSSFIFVRAFLHSHNEQVTVATTTWNPRRENWAWFGIAAVPSTDAQLYNLNDVRALQTRNAENVFLDNTAALTWDKTAD